MFLMEESAFDTRISKGLNLCYLFYAEFFSIIVFSAAESDKHRPLFLPHYFGFFVISLGNIRSWSCIRRPRIALHRVFYILAEVQFTAFFFKSYSKNLV